MCAQKKSIRRGERQGVLGENQRLHKSVTWKKSSMKERQWAVGGSCKFSNVPDGRERLHRVLAQRVFECIGDKRLWCGGWAFVESATYNFTPSSGKRTQKRREWLWLSGLYLGERLDFQSRRVLLQAWNTFSCRRWLELGNQPRHSHASES